MSKYANIVREFNSRAWAITPEKLAELTHVLTTRVAGGVIPADIVAAYKESAAQRRAATPSGGGSVAVIPIYGTISQRPDIMSSGGTSTLEVGAQFDAAMANASVGSIVLDIDSPGGSVSGVPELAAKIRAARGQGKQIIAVANSLCASAAYWIASAADKIVASPSADVGSIGVYAAHVDASAQMEDLGLKYTLVSAGKYKVEGHPFGPLSDEARDAMQAGVDEFYAMFTSDVARSRDVSAKDVRNGYGEGRVLSAKAALAAGMVDEIGTLDDVLGDLTRGAKTTVRRAASTDLIDRVAATLIADKTITLASQNADLNSVVVEWARNDNTSAATFVFPSPTASPFTAPASEPSSATDDEASAAVPSPTLDTAPQARSHTVPNENTAASGAAPGETPVSRETQIGQLAQLAGKDLAWTMNAITSGLSVQAIQSQLASERLSNTAPAAATGVVRNMVDRAADRPFATLGEQLMAVVQAGRPGGRVDPRLTRINAAVSGMNESVGSEGGFFVESQLLPGLTEPAYAEDPFLSRVTQIPIGAGFNGVKYNVVDETSRATGSRYGGVRGYWVAEADTATASKPKLRQFELNLKKLMAVAYLTDELMQDGVAAEGLVTRAFQNELRFLLTDAVFRGTGAGQPLGFLGHSATVSVAIEASQTIANTGASISMNVAKMLARIPASLKGGAIWLYNQELLPYLINATLGSTGVPIFMSGQNLASGPQDTILGRAAFASDFCSAVGTVGDIVCVVPSEYHMTAKGGVNQATSAHVRFLYDEQALKFTYRVDGAPVWSSSLTPFKGSNALSPFVTLAVRS